MTEENVTKAILKWLIEHQWKIVCFDFPQSGTGRFLHPNQAISEKNKASVNPDIVAVRENICVFFENKNRFYSPDYEKVHYLIENDDYSEDIYRLLKNYEITNIYYGIGLPTASHKRKSVEMSHLVDFIIGVDENQSVSVLYRSCSNIFDGD